MTRARASTRRMLTTALVAATLLTGRRALADDGVPADAADRAAEVAKLNDEGMSLYRARDYRHAVEKFLHAEALDQDPNLLYNIARCYEMLGERGAAIEKYEAFMAKPDADPQGKRRAADAVKALRQAPEEQSAALPAAPAAVPPSAAAVGSKDPAPAGPRAAAPAPESFWSARVITLGAGVLVSAAGAAAYMMGVSDHNKVTGSAGYGVAGQVDPLTEAEAHRLVNSGNSKKLVGELTLGVGGALLVTSAILFGVHAARDGVPTREGRTLSLMVSPTPTGGGLLLEGRF